jgi:hypothetical protein
MCGQVRELSPAWSDTSKILGIFVMNRQQGTSARAAHPTNTIDMRIRLVGFD